MTTKRNSTAVLLLVCPDTHGIVSSLSSFVSNNNGNIKDSDFHTDEEKALFLGRVEWSLDSFDVTDRADLREKVRALCDPFKGQWNLHFSDETPRIAIWCSKQDHCILDLLNRHRNGDLGLADIAVVVSNHEDLRARVENYGVPFHLVKTAATAASSAEEKAAEKVVVERRLAELMKEQKIDIVVLAKYMQILSNTLVTALGEGNVVNIHHSFLPAFVGAKPYHQAHERGVKIIGATAHFVTAELDAGPIIEQDVVRVSHRETVADLVRKGKDLERVVLARAVRLCIHRRVLKFGNKTVIFE